MLEKNLATTSVSVDTPPEDLTQMIGNIHFGNIITFLELDIPEFWAYHNEPQHITIDVNGKKLARVFVDNGSAVNIFPAKMMSVLDISPETLKPSGQSVRGYDSTSRSVLGVVSIPLTCGDTTISTEFQVVDISSTFTLLLGRPWLHRMNGVPSSLHQCVKFQLGDHITVVYSDLVTSQGSNTWGIPVLQIQHDESSSLFSGIQIVAQAQACAVDLTQMSGIVPLVVKIMRKHGVPTRLGLG